MRPAGSRALKLIGTFAAGAGALAYATYRRDITAAVRRVETGRQLIDTPEGVIEFAEAGEGPAVLVIHGAGGGFDQGLELGATFTGPGYRIVAPSRFGYLGSTLPGDASPQAQADAFVRVLDTLRLEKTPVVGVSAGGPSAVQFCLRHPDRCSALVLIVAMAWTPGRETTTARVSPLLQPLLNVMLSSEVACWVVMKTAPLTMVRTILGTPVATYRLASSSDQERARQMLRTILPITRRAAGLANEAVIAESLSRYPFEEMRLPVLVISAEDDLYDTWESGALTAEQVPEGRFIGFQRGGHLLLGHEDEVRSEVRSVLEAHSVKAAAVA